jgi:hypothetical protein
MDEEGIENYKLKVEVKVEKMASFGLCKLKTKNEKLKMKNGSGTLRTFF